MTLQCFMARSVEDRPTRWEFIAALPDECLPAWSAASAGTPPSDALDCQRAAMVEQRCDAILARMTQDPKDFQQRAGAANFYALARFVQKLRAWCLERPEHVIRIEYT